MEENLTKNETIKEEPKKEEVIDLKEADEKLDKKSIKINKKTVIISAAVIVLLVVLYFIKGFFVVATVNGNPISRLSLISKLEQQGGASVLDSIITEKLIENEARAKKIVVSSDEINEEIKKVEDQVKSQGGTLEAILESQGMTLNDVKRQITLQKQVEKLLSDKISVTDEEVAKYIKDNGIKVEGGQELEVNTQVKSALSNEKLNTEVQTLINDLKSKAKIRYFVKY